MRYILGAVALFAIWLLMSGVYKPITMTLGAISSAFAVYIAARANMIDGARVAGGISFLRYMRYLGWLMVEIAKTNFEVVKHILKPRLNFKPAYIPVPYDQKTEVGQVTFANSITLTPGTLTVEVGENQFSVHTLDFSESDNASLKDMNDRISATETS